jgi:hypothetical protein
MGLAETMDLMGGNWHDEIVNVCADLRTGLLDSLPD